MNPFNRLARYIFLQTLGGVAIAAVIVLSAIMLVDVVEQIRLVGTRAELSLGAALRLTALRAPFLFEQTLPFVVLVGILFSLVRLTRRNEITVMRAGGVSPWGLAAPAMALAGMLGMLSTGLLSPVSTALQEQYENERNVLTKTSTAKSDVVWLSQGDAKSQIMLRAERADPAQATLHDVTVFMFYIDAQRRRRFLRRLEAKEARLAAGAWNLSQVQETSPFAPPASHAVLRLKTDLRPEVFSRDPRAPAQTSFYALPSAIEAARLAGLKPRGFEVRFHTLLALPMLLAAMALIGVAFSDRLHRLGGVSAWIAVGIGTGFCTYFLGQISSALASVGAVPPIAAGWGPPLAALFAASAALAAASSHQH